MLVSSRKKGEQIVIPDSGTTVTVLGVEGTRIRLGITAPAEVGVLRGELHQHQAGPRGERVVAADQEMPKSIRVLIADTDENLPSGYCEQMSFFGCDVVVATSGVECLQKLRECAPDVLVLEPSIPWGGGDGVLAVMHEQADVPRVPVLILTYGRDRGVLYRLAPYQVDDFQGKPISPKKLAERIRAIAKRARSKPEPAIAAR